jgi:hemerythrin-like domain-containing protein
MSKAIDDLRHEHEAILSALAILDAMTGRLGGAGAPSAVDLRGFLGFLKEFADRCHHGKEEGILFPALVEAGIPEKGGPIGQMLAEHAEGRKLIKGMEVAIEGAVDARAFTVAANGYASLLRAHIGKENDVLFPVGEKVLTSVQLDGIFERFEEHEEKVIGHGRHEELQSMLKELKLKYPSGTR